VPPGPYEYNNSVPQVVIYLVGKIKPGLVIAQSIQIILFIFLAAVYANTVFAPRTEEDPYKRYWEYLRWFFVFYCMTFLSATESWDYSLGLPIFIFLASQGRLPKILIGIPLLLVAFQGLVVLLLNLPGWFPFTFTTVAISLFFLMITKPQKNKTLIATMGDVSLDNRERKR
jgi:hypothetical protein